jgi:ORF6N domain
MGLPIPIEQIRPLILLIRGKKVMLDTDLARLYGVPTKRLNEQVKRNRDRFPEDFMFQLTAAEKTEVVAKCDHLARLKFSSTHPYAFTEHGAIMLAAVLNTPRATEVSVFVVRAFVRLREIVTTHKALAQRLAEMESRIETHGEAI